MKWNFLYQITAAFRTPDKEATASRSPFSLSSTEFVEPPPPHSNKTPGYATVLIIHRDSVADTKCGIKLYMHPTS